MTHYGLIDKARRDLGYEPVITVQEAMVEILATARRSREVPTPLRRRDRTARRLDSILDAVRTKYAQYGVDPTAEEQVSAPRYRLVRR